MEEKHVQNVLQSLRWAEKGPHNAAQAVLKGKYDRAEDILQTTIEDLTNAKKLISSYLDQQGAAYKEAKAR
jgi:hypothetical protein